MTAILRHRVVLTGWDGGPGVLTTYWRPGTGGGSTADATDVAARVRAWLVASQAVFHASVVLTPDRTCDALEDTDGSLLGSFSAGSPASLIGGTGGNIAPPQVMMEVRWNTGSVLRGRRLIGHSNLGPIANVVLGADGKISSTNVTAVQTASTALLTGGTTASFPVVWSRPHTASTRDPRPSYAGDSRAITSATALAKTAVLRSRRDS